MDRDGFWKTIRGRKWSMPGTSSQRNGCQDTPPRTNRPSTRHSSLFANVIDSPTTTRQPHRAPSCNLFNPALKPSAYSHPPLSPPPPLVSRSVCQEFHSPPPPPPEGRVSSRMIALIKSQFPGNYTIRGNFQEFLESIFRTVEHFFLVHVRAFFSSYFISPILRSSWSSYTLYRIVHNTSIYNWDLISIELLLNATRVEHHFLNVNLLSCNYVLSVKLSYVLWICLGRNVRTIGDLTGENYFFFFDMEI